MALSTLFSAFEKTIFQLDTRKWSKRLSNDGLTQKRQCSEKCSCYRIVNLERSDVTNQYDENTQKSVNYKKSCKKGLTVGGEVAIIINVVARTTAKHRG